VVGVATVEPTESNINVLRTRKAGGYPFLERYVVEPSDWTVDNGVSYAEMVVDKQFVFELLLGVANDTGASVDVTVTGMVSNPLPVEGYGSTELHADTLNGVLVKDIWYNLSDPWPYLKVALSAAATPATERVYVYVCDAVGGKRR
jgi:hypothetical protein